MPISDKTRKILWGRSANRCAMCRQELVIAATTNDDDSIAGEECHIISGQLKGPRHDAAFPADRIDAIENLVLLCRVHHKMVDDQHETYSVQVLKDIKANHERWVSSKLTEAKQREPLRVRRIEENIPEHLVRITSGRELLNIVSNAHVYSFDYDDPESDSEAQLLSGFLQEAQDWGDLLSDGFEAGQRVEAAYRMNGLIKDAEEAGFWVFGARETQWLEGGIEKASDWHVAILRLIRSTNRDILKVELRHHSQTDEDESFTASK